MDRTGYLGGSDMAAILGIDPFKTRLHVYLSAIGEPAHQDETDAMAFGTMMEEPIARLLAHKTGREVLEAEHQVVHPEHDFLCARVDRQFDDEHGIEIKNVGRGMSRHWGPSGDPLGVAEHYLPQVHFYMVLGGYQRFTVVAYFGGSDLRIYNVERDDELSGLIIESAVEFWRSHVEPRIPPDPDFEHARTPELIRKLYPGTTGEVIQASEDSEQWAAVYADAISRAKVYEAAANSAKQHLLWAMGEAAVLEFDDGSKLKRNLVKRKGYEVAATEYMQASFVKSKG